jgi:hypothetical protein
MEKKITLGIFPALFFAFWNPPVSSTSSNVAQLLSPKKVTQKKFRVKIFS